MLADYFKAAKTYACIICGLSSKQVHVGGILPPRAITHLVCAI